MIIKNCIDGVEVCVVFLSLNVTDYQRNLHFYILFHADVNHDQNTR